jgi:predicted permease
MFQDLRFGLKLLLKERGFTIAALLTLALCIGANTAIFTVLDSVVLRGLPFSEPDRLVTMYNIYPGVGVTDFGANGVPDYLDRKKLTRVFSEVTIFGDRGYDVGLSGTPQRITGQYVTPSFFRVLRVQPVMGRVFMDEEAVLGKEHEAVLSEGLWKELFAGDPGIVGKDIRLSGIPYRVVGVVPNVAGSLHGSEPVRIWVPFAFTPEQTSDDARHNNSWGMMARLQPGVSIAQAQQRIDTLNHANLDLFPKYKQLLINARFGTVVRGVRDEMVRDIRPTLYLLQAAVVVVLLIGCVNLANLMLVRSNIRMKELAIRFSLGAGRLRIARQLMTESVLLALAGGALGVGVAWGGIQLLAGLGAKDLPRGETIQMDGATLAFTALTAILTGIVFGSVPLFNVLRRDLTEVFRTNERGGTAGRHALWVRSALVVGQISLAFVLLIGSGLLTLSFAKLLKVSPGFHAENVITAQIAMPDTRYKNDTQRAAFITGLMDRLRSTPGVRQAGASSFLPFSNSMSASAISIVGYTMKPGENPPVPAWNEIDPGYLGSMGIPLLQGRNFSAGDTAQAPKALMIDQFLAHKYWPRGDAIGGQIRQGIENNAKVYTVVGVVGSVKTGNLAEQNPVGQIYFPYQQNTPETVQVVVKTDRDDPGVVSAIRTAARQIDPELPIYDVKAMSARVAASVVDRRAAMVLCAIFGALALLLSAIGIYGVLAYAVTQRTREFGIRTALGAAKGDIVGMVVGNGLRLAGLGLLIGAAAAFVVTRLMTTMLYDVKPADPGVFAGVAAVLGGVALIASLIPSLRAAAIRPSVALRYE